eukprot:TRINITY_DN16871_c0_g1_i3.p1 TRINITY_DN16871_c0_g1~~TRINITY_DN16871_c0_g1_i3.p1  ORF type:complete len:379 (-),score=55.28 TRINITY_DN16871_c0_g1_i3:546-1625(-)
MCRDDEDDEPGRHSGDRRGSKSPVVSPNRLKQQVQRAEKCDKNGFDECHDDLLGARKHRCRPPARRESSNHSSNHLQVVPRHTRHDHRNFVVQAPERSALVQAQSPKSKRTLAADLCAAVQQTAAAATAAAEAAAAAAAEAAEASKAAAGCWQAASDIKQATAGYKPEEPLMYILSKFQKDPNEDSFQNIGQLLACYGMNERWKLDRLSQIRNLLRLAEHGPRYSADPEGDASHVLCSNAVMFTRLCVAQTSSAAKEGASSRGTDIRGELLKVLDVIVSIHIENVSGSKRNTRYTDEGAGGELSRASKPFYLVRVLGGLQSPPLVPWGPATIWRHGLRAVCTKIGLTLPHRESCWLLRK